MLDLTCNILAIFGLPGGSEWILILLVALLIFGRRLPEVARGAGKSLSEFKKGVKEGKENLEDVTKLDEDDVEDDDKK